jgi:uncharacterized protein (DUF2384 family)
MALVATLIPLITPPEYHRSMTLLRLRSAIDPFREPAVAFAAARVLSLAETCGLWSPAGTVDVLTPAVLQDALAAVADAGVPVGPLLWGVADGDAPDDRLVAHLAQVEHAITSSPVPERELPRLRDLLGTELLEQLVGVSPASLRRYLAGERTVPDDVGERAHHLALVVNDLVGSYNDRGVRRWFERARPQLGGRSPRAVLGRDWSPDGDGPQEVAALAAALPDLGAT